MKYVIGLVACVVLAVPLIAGETVVTEKPVLEKIVERVVEVPAVEVEVEVEATEEECKRCCCCCCCCCKPCEEPAVTTTQTVTEVPVVRQQITLDAPQICTTGTCPLTMTAPPAVNVSAPPGPLRLLLDKARLRRETRRAPIPQASNVLVQQPSTVVEVKPAPVEIRQVPQQVVIGQWNPSYRGPRK